ncbi:hypothetical protein AB6A40_004581 [Gnathostoma spinigerum]|uniref:Uncharacterized protein n=1 Tax=Gnathostoma spinigerum TaxID=75299 RepID=A0ABD6EMS9_9BILA
MQSADAYGIMVSEDIYLALRPRNFNFRSSPIKLPDNFNAYVFDDQNRRSDTESLSDDNAEETASPPAENPLQLFASMESSFSSDVYSIDIGVETESDMEWITPEMLEYERHAAVASTSALYTEESAPSRSEFSENDELKRRQGFHRTAHTAPLSGSNADNRYSQSSSRCLSPRQRRRRKFRSHNPSRDFTRSTYSELNRPYINGAERLAAAASRVDRMLEELEAVADLNAKVECQPFPLTTSVRSLRSLRRDLSSACHTEYDNADSEGICSDSEMIGSRLEELKNALRNEDSGRKRRRRIWGKMDTGNEADIDSVCSSITNSSIFEHLRWNSVHSIGYENEYEVASKEDLKALARDQMEALSRDIRRNFGDYHLSTFSDIEA